MIGLERSKISWGLSSPNFIRFLVRFAGITEVPLERNASLPLPSACITSSSPSSSSQAI